jgi:hypothetical protein
VLGWSIFFLAAVVGILLMGWRLLRRATGKAERSDFLRMGNRLHWDTTRFDDLPGPIGVFVQGVLAEPSVASRIDLVCERLAEVDFETRQVPYRLAMLGRTVLVMGGLFGIILVSHAVREHSGSMAGLAFVPILLSSAAALCCRWMGRLVSSDIEFRRGSWDVLSRLLLRSHMPGLCVEGDTLSAAPDDPCYAPTRPKPAMGGSKDRRRRRKINDGVMFGVR